MFKKQLRWFKKKPKTDFEKLRECLLNNPKKLLESKYRFEKAFGVNSRLRTSQQWQRLVNLYGIRTVCEMETMTEDEVRHMMIETYDEKLRRRLKK